MQNSRRTARANTRTKIQATQAVHLSEVKNEERRVEAYASSQNVSSNQPTVPGEVNRSTDLSSLNLNWRERDLPERVRTKHVHRLHPYLGKYIPQLVEIFLRKFRPTLVCDPFSGSGTTLVECLALGIDSIGCDISEFNCLITRAKTTMYDLALLEREIKQILTDLNLSLGQGLFAQNGNSLGDRTEYLRRWFHPRALDQLIAYRSLTAPFEYSDLFKVILSRAARSSRLTTHFELDWPKNPITEPYYCFKHSRTCQPTDDALQFLNRYSLDTLKRVREFSQIRQPVAVENVCVDAREFDFPSGIDAVITSPPYVGIIDYHEQHRYAYELLDLPLNSEHEIGPAFKGSSKASRKLYTDQIAEVFANIRRRLAKDAVVVIVVNDRHGLYDDLPQRLGFRLETKLERHVNRRTGIRSSEFFESILLWRRAE